MNLREYYRRISAVEAEIDSAHVWVTSLETSNGGKAGVVNEVPRAMAARMIVDQQARLATEGEACSAAALAQARILEREAAARQTDLDRLARAEREVRALQKLVAPARRDK